LFGQLGFVLRGHLLELGDLLAIGHFDCVGGLNLRQHRLPLGLFSVVQLRYLLLRLSVQYVSKHRFVVAFNIVSVMRLLLNERGFFYAILAECNFIR